MGMFREAVGWMGGFIGIQPGMFFLGLAVSSFLWSARGTCQAPTPGSSCNADVLHQRIDIWVCYLIMMMVCSASLTFYVRVLVETAHSSDLRMWTHAMWRHDNDKVVEKKAKHGIACIAGWKRKVVRPCFCLAIAFSFGSTVCAIVALYLSLKLQFGCVNGSHDIDIIPLVVIGVIGILVHVFFGWVAITQD